MRENFECVEDGLVEYLVGCSNVFLVGCSNVFTLLNGCTGISVLD